MRPNVCSGGWCGFYRAASLERSVWQFFAVLPAPTLCGYETLKFQRATLASLTCRRSPWSSLNGRVWGRRLLILSFHVLSLSIVMPVVIKIFIRALAAIESNNEILGDNGIQDASGMLGIFPLEQLPSNRPTPGGQSFYAHFTNGLRINDDCSAIVGEPVFYGLMPTCQPTTARDARSSMVTTGEYAMITLCRITPRARRLRAL